MQSIDAMIEKAHTALHIWEKKSQEEIDVVVREIAKTVHDNAEDLSELTVKETKLGSVEYTQPDPRPRMNQTGINRLG